MIFTPTPKTSCRHTFLFGLVLALLVAPAAWAATVPDAVDAPVDELDDSMGFGYVAETGEVAIAPNTGYVYCPVADKEPILTIHPEYEDQALADLGATVDGDGLWHTSDGVTVEPRYAKSVITEDASAAAESGLAAVSPSRVLLVRAWWPNCRRLKFGYRCAGCYRCPQGCYPLHWANACSVRYSGTRKFKLCQYTGAPWDICYEYTFYRCTVTAYNCTNCTGSALWSASWIGWSCYTGGC